MRSRTGYEKSRRICWFVDADGNKETGIAGHGSDYSIFVYYDQTQGDWEAITYDFSDNLAVSSHSLKSIYFEIDGRRVTVAIDDFDSTLSSPFRWYAFVDVDIIENNERFFERVDEAPDKEWVETAFPQLFLPITLANR